MIKQSAIRSVSEIAMNVSVNWMTTELTLMCSVLLSIAREDELVTSPTLAFTVIFNVSFISADSITEITPLFSSMTCT